MDEPQGHGASWLRCLTDGWLRLPLTVRALAPCAWGALIWWASSQPAGSGSVPLWRNILSNAAHLGIFAVLAALLIWAMGDPRRRPARLLWGVVLAIAYGVVDEWHQSSVPGRVASLSDLLSDAFGAGFAAVLLGWWHGVRRLVPLELLGLAVAGCGSVAWAVWG